MYFSKTKNPSQRYLQEGIAVLRMLESGTN